MKCFTKVLVLAFVVFGFVTTISAQNVNTNKFRQLNQELPTPNSYRNGAGLPGNQYWQQQVDYEMSIRVNDSKQSVHGEEMIHYKNNSPDALRYLWLQLDQNMRAKDSDTYKTKTSSIQDRMSISSLKGITPTFDGGFKLEHVQDANGKALEYVVNKTMMRIDLPMVLNPGESYSFSIKWWYNINDRMQIGGRSGYEYFEEDDNYLYTIAQFFPRLCVYDDYNGWQNKQFLGNGEFALEFGDYDVKITVPDDHLVAATGELVNAKDILTKSQLDALEKAKTSYKDIVIIANQKDAEAREKKKSSKEKTWHFKAENVRDFAFATSRKFIWDAMGVKQPNGTTVMAMSMYPKEGNPLWEQYSTKSVAHTLKWYTHYTFDYPYPVAWSIHTKRIGMEYPMICFNYGRPEKDGTYTERMKYGMISVIIHEVGHNYFPMIVSSDERQWTWMDEGLNTYLQFLTENEWERNYPSRRGEPYKIVNYMKGDKSRISPIMTNSESIYQFGNNAYGKPATALNILRETVVGRELFDFAFKEYSRSWMYKHPNPADFFRSIEDASAVDLDWFWRGWFYTNDHVDISLENVVHYKMDTKDPNKEKAFHKTNRDKRPETITEMRNKKLITQTYDEMDKDLIDFYSTYDPLNVDAEDRRTFKVSQDKMSDELREMIAEDANYYELTFKNVGGLVMPLIIEFNFTDGSSEIKEIPAEIWRMSEDVITKVFKFNKDVENVVLDPRLETADTDLKNNYWPRRINNPSKFEAFKRKNKSSKNPMQRAK